MYTGACWEATSVEYGEIMLFTETLQSTPRTTVLGCHLPWGRQVQNSENSVSCAHACLHVAVGATDAIKLGAHHVLWQSLVGSIGI